MKLLDLNPRPIVPIQDVIGVIGHHGRDVVCLELLVSVKVLCSGLSRLFCLFSENTLCAAELLFVGVRLDCEFFLTGALVGVGACVDHGGLV